MNKEMDIDYLDKHFPKGNEYRGEAMVLIGLARLEGNYLTRIRSVLQKECNRHIREYEHHRKMYEIRNSNRQKANMLKHIHKRWEVEHIADLLNIKLDKKLNQIDFLKSICNPENSDYRAIKERIKELESLK
jgi:hypothetical protein